MTITATAGHRSAELDRLAHLYGSPVAISQTLRLKRIFGAVNERPVRVAEVVPVIKRPSGGLIVITKDGYPAGAYRLPSGEMRQGEGILDALLRETYEETGLHVSVERFLAVIRYQLIAATGRTGRFASYVFLVRGDGPIQPVDLKEQITGFREIQPADLKAMADLLANLSDGDDYQWSDWGRFRSVVHRVVADVLAPHPLSGGA